MKKLLLAALFGLSACTGVDSLDTNHQGVDTSMACPEGQIGWDFGTEAPDPLSSAYQDLDASVIPVLQRKSISVQSASCAGTPLVDETNAARAACSGSRTCAYTPLCTGAFTVVWECGAGDRGPNGSTGGYSATVAAGASNRAATMECKQPSLDAGTVPSRKACVPKVCRGQTRRDLDLKCVTDSTMYQIKDEEVSVTSFNIDEIYNGWTVANTDGGFLPNTHPPASSGQPQTLFNNSVYQVKLEAFFPHTFPEKARLALWFTDTFEINGRKVEVFRCLASDFDVGSATAADPVNPAWVKIDRRMTFSKTCWTKDRFEDLRKEAFERAGVAYSLNSPFGLSSTTKANFSYDMEGVTEFIPKEHNEFSACAPNPEDFFYDRVTKRYDMVAYYKQRQISRVSGTTASSFYWRESPRIEIGPIGVAARDLAIEIPLYSPIPATVPIDVSWYMSGDSWVNPYSLVGELAQMKKKDDGSPYAGGAFTSNTGPSIAPPNLRARVYIMPHTFPTGVSIGTDYPLLGEIPLVEAAPTGSTVSKDLRLSPAIKTLFFKEGSLLYIPPENTTGKTYELMYCIVSDRPDLAFEPRVNVTGLKYRYEMQVPAYRPRENAYPDYQQYSIGLGNEKDAAAAFNPYPASTKIQPGRGCRFAEKPITITLDRTVRTLVPIDSRPWGGTASNPESGDKKMSQNMDNDAQRTCPSGANCKTVNHSGLRGQGEFAKTYYQTHSEGDMTDGSELSGDADVEALGFQIIAPSEPDMAQPWPTNIGSNTPPISIKIAPPWDALWSVLHNSARGSPIVWERGRYAGIMGLGVGWGFKIPIQMGPVPGLITITASAGIAIALNLEWRVTPEKGSEYPCLSGTGTNTCFQETEKADTLPNTAKACNVAGGRLAELSTLAEAGLVDSRIRASTETAYWIGANVGYRYPTVECSDSYNATRCAATTKSSYRWLSNDKEFAYSTGPNSPTYTSDYFGSAGLGSLNTQVPDRAGVIYNRNGSFQTAKEGEKYKGLCIFDPAKTDKYHKFTAELEVGAAVGLGISFCVPNDNIGFCLEGSFNLAALSIKPQTSYAMHNLTNLAGKKSTRSNTNVQVPWALTLLEGSITAKIALFFTTFEWKLISFDGFKVASGMLFNYDSPSIEAFQ